MAAGALLGAPAIVGLALALLLGVAAWRVGGFGPGGALDHDPIVSFVMTGNPRDPGSRRFGDASRLAALDHRYPFREARGLLFPAGGVGSGADYHEAYGMLRESARRAPSDAVVRLLLFEVAAALGRETEADAQAMAAANLAPLNLELRRFVSRHFQGRYDKHGTSGDLSRAIETMEGDLAAVIDSLKDDRSMAYETAAAAFSSAHVDGEWAVDALITAERFDWAVRWAQESGAATTCIARALGARGRTLLARGDAAGARLDLEEAKRLSGPSFHDAGPLGEARLAVGDPSGGSAALAEALAAGEAPAEITARFDRAGAPEAALEFWAREARGGRPAVRLELAVSLVRVGRGAEAAEVLRDLLRAPGMAGPANCLMARILLETGNRAMARRYAREAVAADPRSPEYAELLRRIGE